VAFKLLGEVSDDQPHTQPTVPAAPNVDANLTVGGRPATPPPGESTGFRLLGEVKPEPDPQSWFQRNISGPVTGVAKEMLAQSPVGDVGWLVGGKEGRAKAGDVGARFIVPQSGTEAGIMLGTLGAGPALSAAGKVIPPLGRAVAKAGPLLMGRAGATTAQKFGAPAARIAGATAGGAIGGGVTGEGAGKGALLGAGSALAGESMVALAGKLVRSLPGAQTAIDRRMAKDVGKAIEDISAPLKGAKTAKDLQQLAVEGERKLGLAKERIVQHIEAHTKPILAPSLGRKAVTLRTANEKLTEMGKHAFSQAGTLADKQAYHRLSKEIADGLDVVDPSKAARGLWEQAQANYRKGLGLIDMLTPKPTFTRGPLGVRLKTPTVQEYLADPRTQQELRSRLAPAEFNRLVNVLTRGGGLGTKDALKSLYPTTLTGGLLGSGLGVGGGLGLGPLGGGLAGLPMLVPNVLSRYAGRAPAAPGQGVRTLADLLAALGISRATQPPNQ
jgi:hypothetical protein